MRRASSLSWAASPFDLAILRIVVCGLALAFTDIDATVALAKLPRALQVIDDPWRFPLAVLPVDPDWTRVTGLVFKGGCALGLLGLATRPALVVATLSGLYFLGVTQHVGAVVHHHHLVWFLAIVAASPCADTLAVDAARDAAATGKRPPPAALRYGIPLWTGRVLIGVIFFFPGLHKLLESGMTWAWSDNLRNQMYWKWVQHDAMSWRIDRFPWLMRALATLALAFELTALPFVFVRRLRPWVAAGGFVFHMATELLMHIGFTSLWPTYVVLLDCRRVVRGLFAEMFQTKLAIRAPAPTLAALRSSDVFGRLVYREGPRFEGSWLGLCLRHPLAPIAMVCARFPRRSRSMSSATPALLVGATLLISNVVAGATATTQAWPHACYPTFQWVAGESMPTLAIEAVRRDGSVVTIDATPRSQKEWGIAWSIIGATHGPFDRERLGAYWKSAATQRAAAQRLGAIRVRFYRAEISVVPDRRGTVTSRVFLAEFAP